MKLIASHQPLHNATTQSGDDLTVRRPRSIRSGIKAGVDHPSTNVPSWPPTRPSTRPPTRLPPVFV